MAAYPQEAMATKRRKPTQFTPKTGVEIPVPKRKDVLGDLGKVAPREDEPSEDRSGGTVKKK
jgi:hypothetical protein